MSSYFEMSYYYFMRRGGLPLMKWTEAWVHKDMDISSNMMIIIPMSKYALGGLNAYSNSSFSMSSILNFPSIRHSPC